MAEGPDSAILLNRCDGATVGFIDVSWERVEAACDSGHFKLAATYRNDGKSKLQCDA